MSAASVLSRDECRKIVKRYIRREDFEVKALGIYPLSAEMKGFMGDHMKLRVTVSLWHRVTPDVTTVELQFFVKSVPLDDAYRRNFAMSTLAYQKEVLFYGDILRGVRKHLRGPPEAASTFLGTVPQCYYLRPDLLVLEDLSLVGFRLLDPVQPLSLDQCECVLKALARLHGASLVYEEREGKRLAEAYPLLLEETLFRKEEGFPLYDAQLSCVCVAHVLLDLVPRYAEDTPHNEELHRLLDSTMEEVYELIKPSDKYRNVLCHRDLWVNNMLFAEDAKGDVSVRLVDFQTLHLEPPAHDVMVFLHLVMVREARKVHSQTLLELYHQTLARVLRQHDLDVDSILPLKDFLESCEGAKRVAVILAAYVLQFTMLPLRKDTDLQNFVLDRTALVRAAYRDDPRFRKRVEETMEDLVETCLLPRLEEAAAETSQQ